MERRVIRVRIPVVQEFDVVFEDDNPVFVGAVIRRPASMKGPDAGKLIDTHRVRYDTRKDARYQLSWPGYTRDSTSTVVQTANRLRLTTSPADDPPLPRLFGRWSPGKTRRR